MIELVTVIFIIGFIGIKLFRVIKNVLLYIWLLFKKLKYLCFFFLICEFVIEG